LRRIIACLFTLGISGEQNFRFVMELMRCITSWRNANRICTCSGSFASVLLNPQDADCWSLCAGKEPEQSVGNES